jgi:hypothetical protein
MFRDRRAKFQPGRLCQSSCELSLTVVQYQQLMNCRNGVYWNSSIPNFMKICCSFRAVFRVDRHFASDPNHAYCIVRHTEGMHVTVCRRQTGRHLKIRLVPRSKHTASVTFRPDREIMSACSETHTKHSRTNYVTWCIS